MNRWPEQLLRIISICLRWFSIKLLWRISVHLIKTWHFSVLSRISAWSRMNSVKVIFLRVVNLKSLNGSLVKRNWRLLYLPFNLMKVKVFRLKMMTMNNRIKIVKDCPKNVINIWNNVLKIWYINTISLLSLYIQI